MKAMIPKRTSLAEEVARVLREQLAAGRWARFLPGEHELGRELRVSRMTLRAALDQLARQHWLAKGGHGRRHRVLVRSRSGTRAQAQAAEVRVLSLLSPDRVVTVMQTALRHLQTGLEVAGYTCHFTHVPLSAGRRAEAELERLTAQRDVAGWVLYCASEQMQRWFEARRLPCLVLGACFPGVNLPGVEFDARAIGRHAGHQFLRRGHTRFALVRPSLVLAGDEQCGDGLREAVRRQPAPAEVLDLAYEPNAAGIRLAMKRALTRPQPPTAFFVAQPNFVWPVIGCLQRAGWRIPQDAAVISRADDLFLETSVPEVARYAHDGALLGNAAARLLRSLLKSARGPNAGRKLMPEFIPGESLG